MRRLSPLSFIIVSCCGVKTEGGAEGAEDEESIAGTPAGARAEGVVFLLVALAGASISESEPTRRSRDSGQVVSAACFFIGLPKLASAESGAHTHLRSYDTFAPRLKDRMLQLPQP